jgi:phosphoadenosine phosphosulfate reductase
MGAEVKPTAIPLQIATPAGGAAATGRIGPQSSADDIIAWALQHFADRRILFTTQFGMEGCALIDMLAKHGQPMTVVYLDTMFFFPETYDLRDRLVARYPHIAFENRGTTFTAEEQAARHGPELWKRDPDLCCKIRKVDPMADVMKDVDVWFTALRRSQSPSRANLQIIEWDWKFQVLKISPIATWSRKQVWEYIQAHDVPYNPLHEQSYPTIGCTHCTAPVPGAGVTDYTRAGRWAGQDKKECGLHGDGI